jgi:hypothetical protein
VPKHASRSSAVARALLAVAARITNSTTDPERDAATNPA